MAESECTVADDIQLINKPGMSSKVWEYFGLRIDSNRHSVKDGKVICRICYCDVAAKSGNTSNLISHLCHKHPLLNKNLNFNLCTWSWVFQCFVTNNTYMCKQPVAYAQFVLCTVWEMRKLMYQTVLGLY